MNYYVTYYPKTDELFARNIPDKAVLGEEVFDTLIKDHHGDFSGYIKASSEQEALIKGRRLINEL